MLALSLSTSLVKCLMEIHDTMKMELSNLAGSPCQDVFQFIIYGRRRRTVNRPIRFLDGADSTDVTATSTVSTSNE